MSNVLKEAHELLEIEEILEKRKKRLDKAVITGYHQDDWLRELPSGTIFLSRRYSKADGSWLDERLDQYEILFKTRTRATKLRLTLDYYNYVDDYVVSRDFSLANQLYEVQYYGTGDPDTTG